MTKERLRILILWTHISGYMAANWRALAQHDDIQVSAIAWSTDPARNHADFPKEEITGVDLHFVDETDDSLEEIARQRLHAYQPQVVLVAGWGVKAYRRVLRQCSQENPKAIRWKTVMGMDTVWRGSWKQRFARPLLSDYLKRIDAVLVAGPGAKIYAQRLGFPEGSIHRGLYSWDEQLREKTESLCIERGNSFLFVGRYVPIKGLQFLIEAYRNYRSRVSVPWELHCCGTGPLKDLLTGEPGVFDHGFVVPDALPSHFATSRVLILPSLFEPWGVAIAEGMGCGLAPIVSDQCGAGMDLIEPDISGWIIAPGRVEELTERMVYCHENPEVVLRISDAAISAAQGFTSKAWAKRFRQIAFGLLDCKDEI